MALEPKVKKAWVKALRSGKYRQSYASLKAVKNKHSSYCCLGVLAEVKGVKWERMVSYSHTVDRCPRVNGKIVSEDESAVYLDPKFAGISIKIQKKLAEMNDGDQYGKVYNFREIADYIEKNL